MCDHLYSTARRKKTWLTGQAQPVGHTCRLCRLLSRKNNIWPINGHPIDLSVWFLASAHGQKWIRPGPHDADIGSSESASLVIYVQLSKRESWGLHLNLHTYLYENKHATAVVMWGDNAA